MAVSGLLGQRNLLRLDVRCRLQSEAYAGFPAQYLLEIVNQRRRLPAFLLQARIGSTTLLFPLIPFGESCQQILVLTFSQRGLQPLPEIYLSSCFPINFFVRSRRVPHNQQVLVFPRPLKSILPSGTGQKRQARQEDLFLPGIDGELRSVDNYLDGDPLKAIHWKHSARQEESYKVKRLNRLGLPAQLINIENLPGAIEEKLSRCTYLVNRLSRSQRAVGLRIEQKLIPPAVGNSHRCRLLTELARYGQH